MQSISIKNRDDPQVQQDSIILEYMAPAFRPIAGIDNKNDSSRRLLLIFENLENNRK